MRRPVRGQRLYSWLLRIYPRAFRARFGEGMRYDFEQDCVAAARRGRAALAQLWIHTLWHLLVLGGGERIASLIRRPPRAAQTPTPEKVREPVTNTIRELHHATRRLIRAPLFSLATIGALALGIGATTAIYSVVQGVLLSPLPYHDPGRLVHVGHALPTKPLGMPDGGYFMYRDNATTLTDLAVYIETSSPITGRGRPLELGVIRTTPNLLSLLGVVPILGRDFTQADAEPGAPDVVIVSYGFWQTELGGDTAAVGRPLSEGDSDMVVGVLPPDFDFIRPPASVVFGNVFQQPDVLVPQSIDRSRARFGNFMYQGVARLAPEATVDAAQRELDALMRRAPEEHPGLHTAASLEEEHIRVTVTPLKGAIVGNVAAVLWILLGAVGVVLLIATANVANLFLVRAESRRRDIAVRTALGATGGSLSRTFLAESLLLTLVGGAAAVGLAGLATGVLLRLAPPIPRIGQVGIDLGVLGFAFGVSLVCGLVYGLVPPWWQFRGLDVKAAIGDSTRGATLGREGGRIRNTLVVAQVALALVLLVGSALLIRTLQNLRGVDPGFDGSHVLTVQLTVPPSKYRGEVGRSRFLLDLTEQLEGAPGVERVSFAGDLPLDGNEWRDQVVVEGALPDEGTPSTNTLRTFVGPGYLQTIGAPLLRGREMERADFAEYPHVAVVNSAFAEQRWPGESPLGKRIAQWWDGSDPSADIWYTVVGVVGDMRERSLMLPPEPTVYLPTVFLPDGGFAMFVTTMTVLVETAGPPGAAAPELVRRIQAFDPEVPVHEVQTLDALKAASFQQIQFAMLLSAFAACVSLGLGVLGIYAVVAYVVGQRTREFGVRIALGATAGNVRGLVLRQGGALAGGGIVLGLAGAAMLSGVLRSLLFGISPTDLRVYAVMSVVLFVVVVTAALIPAHRAAAVDPVEAIRAE
jgi:putative ABC transport system permease protein